MFKEGLGYPVKPLYTLRDVERTLPLLESVSYHESVRLGENASVVFHEAGHILAAAIVELILEERDVRLLGRMRRVRAKVERIKGSVKLSEWRP